MTWRICLVGWILGTLLFANAAAQQSSSDPPTESNERTEGTAPEQANETLGAHPTILVVVGAAGTPEYGELFTAWAEQWRQVADASRAEFILLGTEQSSKSDREQLQAQIADLPPSGATPVWLVMIGHGTFARGVAKFNLRGLDVSAAELAEWLQPLERPLVIINCASSSGPFVNRLSGPGRVVVTATKSGTEQNFARFGQFLAEAIRSPDSDLDHDDEVSIQEAFVRASAEVQRFYDSEQRLATEHALIDDNADGKGTPASMFRGNRPIAKAKDGSELDGKAAAKMTLAPTGKRLPLTEKEWKQRDALEAELETLRSRKSELSEQEYDAELETILIQLARIYQAAERRSDR